MDSASSSSSSSSSSSHCIFEFLLSNLQASQGLKALDLKNLYALLVSVVKDLENRKNWSFDGSGVEIDVGLNLKFSTICSLAKLLFAELSVRFNKFFSGLDDVSTCEDCGVRVLLLLLRCCLMLLLVLEPLSRLEKGQNLLWILKKLCSVNIIRGEGTARIIFEKPVSQSCEMTYNDSEMSSIKNSDAGMEFLELTSSRLSFMSTVLEVFIDELVVHNKLLDFFHLIDSAAPSGENQFTPSTGHGAIGILVEVASCHFSLSLSDAKSFEDDVSRLFWVNGEECEHPTRPPEMRLTTAASLFLTLIKLGAPRYMLAHMVLLVSEACSSMIRLSSFNINHRLVNYILPIFELSVTLYCEQISSLQIGSHSSNAGVFCSKGDGKSQVSFGSYVSPFRKQKMDDHIRMLDKSSDGILQNIVVGTKSELENSATKYVKECRTIRPISRPNDSLEILSSIILRASDGFDSTQVKSFQLPNLPDVYFLSSLLKLVGTSLHLAILCLKCDDSGCCRTPEDIICCKEYDIILGVTSCFEEYSIHLPVLQQLADCMETVSSRHKGSKMMLITLLGLLSFSFECGVDCLVKGCLLTIMATMNLFASDKDNLGALLRLFDCRSEETSCSLSLVKAPESPVDCTSPSWVVALKYQKLWSLYSRVEDSPPINSMGSEDGPSQALVVSGFSCTEEETEKTSNGEIFANCILKHQKTCSPKADFDDLVDFIECQKGKDYSFWLKDRQRLYQSKWQKRKELMWKKKKQTWKRLGGK